MNPSALVTGLGVMHQAGQDPEKFWQTLCSEHPPKPEPQGVIGLHDFDPYAFMPEDQARRMDRMSQILVATAWRTLGHAGKGASDHPERVGMISSTHLGTLDTILNFSTRIFKSGPGRANPMEFPSTVLNASTGYASMVTGLKGHNNTVCGGDSLAEAFDALSLGRADAILAAGLEEAAEPQQQTVSQWSVAPPQPLSASRQGCWLGEGAAGLFLETPERARARGGPVYAALAGHAETFDAAGYREQNPDGEQLGRAMRLALERTGLSVADIDGLMVSANGMPEEDHRIARALSNTFGKRLPEIPVYAFPGALGLLGGAASAFGALCACLALHTGQWPASPWHRPDPQLPALKVARLGEPFHGRAMMCLTTDHFGVNHVLIFIQGTK